ncbi:hypothetical protein BC939DRAFT_463808 [Gamsiella multidivaricata]|uniref:uncharacterized protein n=1 Tax=Gamsiella multidivaricata TaxID=101098 RepID=UPI00221FD93E|nr:uncharacterized protein BC939DRAFT_463808 [Gamsiella multidivaricata]KAI7818144.1 hypothetical protein BC939DRAFT_463808 [Gamsiella multidivaricata]
MIRRWASLSFVLFNPVSLIVHVRRKENKQDRVGQYIKTVQSKGQSRAGRFLQPIIDSTYLSPRTSAASRLSILASKPPL